MNFEQETAGCEIIQLNIAVNYGGLEDIVAGFQNFAETIKKDKNFLIENTTDIFPFLRSCEVSNIDLLIRTGGYQRVIFFLYNQRWRSFTSLLFYGRILMKKSSEKQFLSMRKPQ